MTLIDSFMFMTGVMSCLWQCHVSLMHTPSKLMHKTSTPTSGLQLSLPGLCRCELSLLIVLV